MTTTRATTDSALNSVHPTLAGTVVLLEDGTNGVEVLLVRRRPDLSFCANAWVFPGGRVDAADLTGLPATGPEHATRQAAAREVLEETGLTVDPAKLQYAARWITPPGNTRCFDTYFYAAKRPAGEVCLDTRELNAHRGIGPRQVLHAWRSGRMLLTPPTLVTLGCIADATDTEDALQRLAHHGPRQPTRRVPIGDGGQAYLFPDDAGYGRGAVDAVGPRHRLTYRGHSPRFERTKQ